MRLSDLQNKDIVSIVDGRNIGNIIDVKINPETGFISSLVVEAGKSFGKIFNKSCSILLGSFSEDKPSLLEIRMQ